MHIKTKKIYYCDFCKKHRLTKNSILYHEERCFKNPNRHCPVCDDAEKYHFEFSTDENPEGWEYNTLEIKGTECPACVIAYANQHKVVSIIVVGKPGEYWDYKKEKDRWLADKAREENENIGLRGF